MIDLGDKGTEENILELEGLVLLDVKVGDALGIERYFVAIFQTGRIMVNIVNSKKKTEKKEANGNVRCQVSLTLDHLLGVVVGDMECKQMATFYSFWNLQRDGPTCFQSGNIIQGTIRVPVDYSHDWVKFCFQMETRGVVKAVHNSEERANHTEIPLAGPMDPEAIFFGLVDATRYDLSSAFVVGGDKT